MPFYKGRFFPDPQSHPPATVKPILVDSTTTYAPFLLAWADELISTLNIHAFLITAFAGSNNDLVFSARTPGTTGTALTVTVVVAGNNTPLTVVLTGNNLVINSATDGSGVPTSTAAQVKAAVEANGAATVKFVVQFNTSNDGTGVIAAQSITSLAGPLGTSPTLDVSLKTSPDGVAAYATFAAFAQVTALAGDGAVKYFAPLPPDAEWVATLSGTGAKFVFSIPSKYRPK